ncbi:MAG TPA: hypothetical protein PLX89_08355 [Verrucomicrobiota bacterium]|nr:hypothetical protein [Verrucomicrobiota bacterium]
MKKPLSDTEPLSLMISSRCNDAIEYQNKSQSLAVLRRELKSRLEGIKIGGIQVFRVWIHEDESNTSALLNNWESCLEKARNADVFIMLYNGRAGWLGTDSPVRDGLGICHAEVAAAFDKAPGKVRSIQFRALIPAAPDSPDESFQQFVSRQKFPGAQVATGEEALQRAEELAAATVLSLAREGVGVNSSGSFYAGEALEWSRMNFHKRRDEMTKVIVKLLRKRAGGAFKQPSGNVAAIEIRGANIGFVCDSIPASMSTAAARELVGQPFLNDYQHTEKWDAAIQGPVHLIACQKSVSENQAIRQLGFPDAVVVSGPFGVYVADEVQKIQMAFIANCRDETTTRGNAQAFLNWLNDHGEAKHLVRRAKSRRSISDYIRRV